MKMNDFFEEFMSESLQLDELFSVVGGIEIEANIQLVETETVEAEQ